MPRYFFNVFDGKADLDSEGTLLPDIYTAQGQAVRLCGEILRDLGAKLWHEEEWRLEVLDEGGRTLFILRFSIEEPSQLISPDGPSPA